MKASFIFILVSFGLISCQKGPIHAGTIAIAPTENVLMLFERYETLGDEQASKWKKHFTDFKGNVLELKNKRSAINYVQAHAPEILLESDLKFLFDTVGTHQRLYVVDPTQSLLLQPNEVISLGDEKQKFTLTLSPRKKIEMSRFFADNIGKELLLFDKDGFVAGASQISKTVEANLEVRTDAISR